MSMSCYRDHERVLELNWPRPTPGRLRNVDTPLARCRAPAILGFCRQRFVLCFEELRVAALRCQRRSRRSRKRARLRDETIRLQSLCGLGAESFNLPGMSLVFQTDFFNAFKAWRGEMRSDFQSNGYRISDDLEQGHETKGHTSGCR